MAEIRYSKVEKGETKIRNVPIAVTPEGFWCCPSPVALQKTLKTHNSITKSKHPPSPPHPAASVHKKQPISTDKKPAENPSDPVASDEHKTSNNGDPGSNVADKTTPKNKAESLPRKVSIEFGEPGTSDMKLVLVGKQGFSVKMSVHRNVLVENSSFFAEKLAIQKAGSPRLHIDDCEDVDVYVEIVGLMYCKDMKQRLIKQSVQRVLRILKVAEAIGFTSCIPPCLAYLEAAPWVGEDEEEKVVSSVLQLQTEGIDVGIKPVLKRVSSNISQQPKDTLSHIIQLVLKSNEEKGRREMKSIVLNLLKENNNNNNNNNKHTDICYETIYTSCKACLDSLVAYFRRAAEPDHNGGPLDVNDPVAKQIAIGADNLAWLLDILAERQAADELALMWANQQELASLHQKLHVRNRYHISCITARLFVGIGRGELLPSKDTRHLLLQTWLEPLMSDYSWLSHCCRSFDRKVVEEGIGRTILTLPLEDQQSILLSWLSNFLKAGDSCPNLQRAFEVWWRRTFIRPYGEPKTNHDQSESSVT